MEYDLFEHQKELLRKMVAALKAGCGPDFMGASGFGNGGIVLIGKNGRQEQIECNSDDLAALNREGLVEMSRFASGSIRPRTVLAVDNNFAVAASPVPASPSIGSLTQNIYGQSIQNAIGNSANQRKARLSTFSQS